MKVYLVLANNNEEWEDYHEWPHKAFVSKEKAQTYIELNNGIIIDTWGSLTYLNDDILELEVEGV